MMSWGRRKSSPPPSSRPSFISHVSPFSWLSKFKQMRNNSAKPNPGKLKQKGKSNSPSVSSSQYACGGDGDGLWRLPFGEESHDAQKRNHTLETVLNDENVIPSSSYSSNSRWTDKKDGRKEGTLKFKEKDTDEYNREKEFENLRRKFEMKAQGVFQEQVLKLETKLDKAESASTKSVEKDVLQLESPRTICTPRKRLSFVPSVDSKSPRELQRQKPTHSFKVRLYSPRTASKVEISKIKALKAKLKMKKAKERTLEETKGLDSFAVVKCSLNPEQDFRDSMVEMMSELELNQPEEMEELLAWYLTLNSDEYHDLIVKVFRQVWFDINKDVLGIKQYCHI